MVRPNYKITYLFFDIWSEVYDHFIFRNYLVCSDLKFFKLTYIVFI